MTMTRQAKGNHQFELHIARSNSGYTTAEWAAPANQARSLAEVGHLMIPADAYREHLMGRRVSSRDRRDVVVTKMRARRVARP